MPPTSGTGTGRPGLHARPRQATRSRTTTTSSPPSTTSSPTGAPSYPELYGEPYPELSGGIFPVYPGREDVPGCGQSLTTYSEIRGNAFYCFDGDFIAYDDADLLPQLYEQLGPA